MFDTQFLDELNKTWLKYNILEEHQEKILREIYDGLPDSTMTQNEIYDFFAKTLFQHSSEDPEFSKIASEFQVKIYSNTIGTDYLSLIKKQYKFGLISDNFYNFVNEYVEKLLSMIEWERDGLIDYFGLKTLERSYLLKDQDKKFIERPQMMWLRCAIQIHGLYYLENQKNISELTKNDNLTINQQLDISKKKLLDPINLEQTFDLIKETYDYMSQLYFTHATPTLFNSGSKFPQLSSCYLLQCPDDLEQIGNSFKSIMMISKWAGGIGINLSDIRSNNSLIKSNGGRTNGIVPLCKVLESLARYVNQSSKRLGSIACFLEVFHADIEDFIELRKNTGDVNLRTRDLFLGLWVSDAFMRAIELDSDWYLMNPNECIGLTDSWGSKFDELYNQYITDGKYVKKIKARELYKKITDCQFETGMPYFMFKDTINARSNQQNLGTIKNSNLCVAPETKILTDKGYFQIKDFKNKKVNVWNGEKFSEVIVRQTGINQKLIKINFSNNVSIECTPYHKFYIHGTKSKTDIVNASDLKPGMKIIEYNLPIIKNNNTKLNFDNTDKYFVPTNYSTETKLKWLAGLCDRDGYLEVNDNYKSIQISSINLEFLDNIRLMLNTLGINPAISIVYEENKNYLSDSKKKGLVCKKPYRLLLTPNHLYHLNQLGFKINRFDNNYEKPQREESSFITITEIIDLGRHDDTYCFNEPEKHSGIFNGILTANCSEIVEYSSPDEIAVCNLASISLPKFVCVGNNNKNYFDFDKLGKIVQIITTNLNNIIDLNFYPVPQTAKSNLSHRPIGIGVQGLADCYFLMGYSFDSEQATKLNKQIFECIYWNSLKKSAELAKIFGKYSSFDNSPFSKGQLQFGLAGKNISDIANSELNLDWVGLIEDIKINGTRNSLLTTVMPTASTSQILNNNESIEPYASNMYVRKVLSGEYLIVNKHLVRDLKEIGMWNSDILTEIQYDNGSIQKLNLPEHIKNKYKTAYELKQSILVKQSIDRGLFIDQSQSMNLFMENPDHNKLASAHMYAWKNGLKTGSYYIRSKPVSEATKFSIDIDKINLIKSKRGENISKSYIDNKIIKDENLNIEQKQKQKIQIACEDEVCINCSA